LGKNEDLPHNVIINHSLIQKHATEMIRKIRLYCTIIGLLVLYNWIHHNVFEDLREYYENENKSIHSRDTLNKSSDSILGVK
jgi:hypothetical protein